MGEERERANQQLGACPLMKEERVSLSAVRGVSTHYGGGE